MTQLDYATSRPPASPIAWLNVALCGVGTVVAAAFMIHESDPHTIDGFTLWVAGPFPLLGCVAFLFSRKRPASSVILLLATIVACALLGLEIYDFRTSHSSTSALVFLIVPALQFGIALLGTLIAAILFRLSDATGSHAVRL